MTLVRSKQNNPISHAFEKEFAAEILKSERLRVTMLMAVIVAMLGLQVCMSIVAHDQFRRSFHGRYGTFIVAVLAIGATALTCLVLQRILLNRRISLNGRPSPFLQYVSALIETSIPTVAMIVGAQFMAPIYTFFTPAGFVYALFIVLSILRLNAGLAAAPSAF